MILLLLAMHDREAGPASQLHGLDGMFHRIDNYLIAFRAYFTKNVESIQIK